jgi:hypothetical protein
MAVLKESGVTALRLLQPTTSEKSFSASKTASKSRDIAQSRSAI